MLSDLLLTQEKELWWRTLGILGTEFKCNIAVSVLSRELNAVLHHLFAFHFLKSSWKVPLEKLKASQSAFDLFMRRHRLPFVGSSFTRRVYRVTSSEMAGQSRRNRIFGSKKSARRPHAAKFNSRCPDAMSAYSFRFLKVLSAMPEEGWCSVLDSPLGFQTKYT